MHLGYPTIGISDLTINTGAVRLVIIIVTIHLHRAHQHLVIA